MEQKSIFIIFLVGIFLLFVCVSCGNTNLVLVTSNNSKTETITVTDTRKPIDTIVRKPSATMSLTSTMTEIPIMPYTSTAVPPTKTPPRDLLISYSRFGNDSCPYFIACIYGSNNDQFLLFSDGQLIIYIDAIYQTTILSEYEIESLISQIEKTGYLDLERGMNIYKETPPDPAFVFTSGQRVSVMGNMYEIRVWQYDYLIDAIPDAISIITSYVPTELEPYFPESMYLLAVPYLGFDSDREFGVPDQEKLYWSQDSIPLDEFSNSYTILPEKYIPFLEENLGHVPANQLVEQNEQTYQVMICPILPDE